MASNTNPARKFKKKKIGPAIVATTKADKNKKPKREEPPAIDGQLNIDARPLTLEDYENLTEAQKTELLRHADKDRAILITGATGVGKTTLAHILANHVARDPRNVFEKNCGTEGGVDEIRKVVASADASTLIGKGRKVFIYDESHKLSQASVSALLVPLESPRKGGALFIFTTNMPNSMLETFRKRCVRINLPDWTTDQLAAFNTKYAKKLGCKPLTAKQLAKCPDPRSILTEMDGGDIMGIEGKDESELKAQSLLPILLHGVTNGRNLPTIDFSALMYMGRVLRNMLNIPCYADDPDSRAYAKRLLGEYDPAGKRGFNSDDIARVSRAVGLTLQAASAGNVPPIVLLDVLIGHAISGDIVDMILEPLVTDRLAGKSKKAK